MRYEDFARAPRKTVDAVARFAGLDAAALPLDDSGRLTLGPAHVFSGQLLLRGKMGPVEIRLDEDWRRTLGPIQRAGATALTWPLLARYGYTGRRRRRQDARFIRASV